MQAIKNTILLILHFIAFLVLGYFLSGQYLISAIFLILGLLGVKVILTKYE